MGQSPGYRAAFAFASLFVIFPFFLTSYSLASQSAISGYIETGTKTQAEDFEEEEEDREYRYHNYHIRFNQKMSEQFQFQLGSFIYNKDYTSRDSLDNTAKIFQGRGSYSFFTRKDKLFKIALSLRYKEKRYQYTPSSEYDQTVFSPRLSYEKKDSYGVTFSVGMNSYDYLSAKIKDQFSFFSQLGVKKYLSDKKLLITSSYKLESTTRKRDNRQKNKSNVLFGCDYIFDIPFIYKISSDIKFGQMDTKDDDDRDEDFDYEYLQFTSKTTHKAGSRLKIFFSYRYFRKDYLAADLDHAGFHVLSSGTYRVLTDKSQTVDITVYSRHKEVDYTLKSGNDYQKETVELRGVYKRKNTLTTSLLLQGDFYDYHDDNRDKNRYYTSFSLGKPFFKKRLKLSLHGKYRFTDNKQSNDSEEKAGRLTFAYAF